MNADQMKRTIDETILHQKGAPISFEVSGILTTLIEQVELLTGRVDRLDEQMLRMGECVAQLSNSMTRVVEVESQLTDRLLTVEDNHER